MDNNWCTERGKIIFKKAVEVNCFTVLSSNPITEISWTKMGREKQGEG